MKYIVSLDIGIASVGWAVIEKETEKVVESGVNLFPEATAAENQTRRGMRQSRRMKRRQKTRLNDFNKLWEKFEFATPEMKETNIADIKVKALNEKISLDELYSILYNYLKHRGISYLEDADQDATTGNSSYANGLQLNAKELEIKYPCEIQKERLKKIGKYRGQTQIVDENGDKLDLSNVFTIGAYRKEILRILEVQKEFYEKLTDEFCDEYLMIFNRKRKYYEGPGNEKSRTDYGKYTTNLDEEGEYITEKNIFEKLIGKCSVYTEELRAAAASYTAQEFNLLNDLNNLTINERKLSEDEKREIVKEVKNSNSINMRKIIANVMNEKIGEFQGARVDKSEKEIFHKFETYNKMRKALLTIDVNIETFSREELDEIGYILTINTDKEALIEAFRNATFEVHDSVRDCLIDLRRNNGSLFNKWHSFSLKVMNELIPVMYEQPKEQMTLLTEMGVLHGKANDFEGIKYIPADAVSEEIFNPVVRRSVRISIRVLNEIMRKYGELDEVIIEMPRDRNSDEQKKRIKDNQKLNEKEMEHIEKQLAALYNIRLKPSDFSRQKYLNLKLKLWNEQDGKCLYSGRTINLKDVIQHPEMFEIDHIIPRSISFDDSRNNKVLVYRTENQRKGNQTPYYYLTHSNGEWNFECFRATVLDLTKKKEYGISRKKVQNLLFSENITKIDVLKGFINRNINDTSYASRVVLNTMQNYFRAKETGTKVKVIKGSYTHQMRVNMKLDKNREDSYSHHAVDAMLMCFAQIGYEAYRKLQGEFIDFETGEILNSEMWEKQMSDDVYAEYLYGMKWSNIRQEITAAESTVKYWFYVDRKANRGLCKQKIRGTREYDGKTYKINNLDIRTEEGVATFKKLAFSSKESDRERLLVYKNDRRTFDNLIQILKDYTDSSNPFVQYEKETGDFVRKYAKKHNGPRIDKLKYTDGEVGSCVDISHKYGHEKGSKKVILESLVPYRMDVYFNNNDNTYYLVGVKQSDIKCEAGKYVVDEEAYAETLLNEKMIKRGEMRSDLEAKGFEFRLSFYKNDIIEYEKDGQIYKERFWSRTMPKVKNYIETNPINKAKHEKGKQNKVGLSKTKLIRKHRMDILGNYYPCEKELFSKYC